MVKFSDKIYCANCNILMQKSILSEYEYLVGLPLKNIPTYKCPRCKQIFFTEKQSASMERKSQAMEQSRFGFERKITISGKSLAVTIPSELAEHLMLKQGSKVKIMPLSNETILVKKLIS